MVLSSAVGSAVSNMPTTPYTRARMAMQRATEHVDRLRQYRDRMIGEPPPPSSSPAGKSDIAFYGAGELGSLDEMTSTLHGFLDDAAAILDQLEQSSAP